MKIPWRKIGFLSLLVFVLLGMWQCKMIVYGLQQGVGQVKIVSNARPIDEVMTDPEFPDSLKAQLHLVQEIRQFAIDSLGIKDSKNYQTVYDQQGKPVLWVLTACDKYQLNPYRWRYPMLGALGYKGYFKKERAEREELKYKKRGFDTDIGEVGAWSTLGWFKDPILSNMLKKSPGGLARLIIHEMTHATLYVKGDADYNENLATFVGDNGAELFLVFKYGVDSKEYKDYLGGISDVRLFGEHILNGSNRLDSLYQSFTETQSDSLKDTLKSQMIDRILHDGDTLKLYNRKRFSHLLDGRYRPNNTFFISFRMYRKEQNAFQKEFEDQFNADFKQYLAYLKEKYPGV